MSDQPSGNGQIIPLRDVISASLEELLGVTVKENLLSSSGVAQRFLSLDQPMEMIFEGLESKYGQQGGRGIAIQIGRSSFLSILQKEGQRMGLLDQDCRYLPRTDRIEKSLERLAEAFSSYWKLPVRFGQNNQYWQWYTPKIPCYFFMGVLQECLNWISGDKIFQFEASNFHSNDDDTSMIKIQKLPLNQ